MKLTKNTRLSKKPFKADNGAILSNSTTQYGRPKPYQVDNFGNKANSPGMDISKAALGTSSSMSPTSFDYSGLATTGMAMGVGAIEKQQASLEAVGKAPSLSGEMGKGALKGAATVTPMALNPMMLAATGGLSALAVPAAAAIGAGVNYVTGNKKIKEFNTQMDAKKSLARQALIDRTNQSSQYNQLDAVNRGYSAQGTNMSSFYKNGGVVYKQGGSLNPISSDTKLAVGRSHEQGGIKMSEDAEIEGGETVVDKGDHTLVVSDNLVNPITGRTFAKDDLRLAKLARKYEGATTQLAKNSLKHVQAKREELHNLQQQMNGDASDMDTAQNGGKVKPINILSKPVKTAVPVRPKPMLAQNGGKLRPINILTKPVKTTPRPSTHLAKDGMKLYGKGGELPIGIFGELPSSPVKDKTNFVEKRASYGYTKGDTPKWTITEKGGKMHKSPEGDYHITAKGEKLFRPVGSKEWQNMPKFPEKIEAQDIKAPAPLKSDPFPTNAKVPEKEITTSKPEINARKVSQSILPGLSRAGKLASYAAPALAQYYANKADIARQTVMKIPDAPQQGFQSLAKQNMEADRAAIRKQQADFNAGVAGTLADSQTAALLKANMASKAGDALVGVNQAERNANIATANAQTEMNLGIDARNKLAKYQQAGMQLEKDIDLSRRKAGNIGELSANLRDVQNTNRQEKYLDMDSAIKVAGLDERGQDYLTRQGANPKGYWLRKNGGKLTKLRK